MNQNNIIQNTIDFVKESLKEAEAGHDWFHIERVYNNSQLIAKNEEVDMFVVKLGALLHDIADAKFHNGDEKIGPQKARFFLNSLGLESGITEHIVQIIQNISFKNSLEEKEEESFSSKELEVIRDADRLDAIGAIGIARAFHYGGFKNRQLYNPEIPPNLNLSKEEYKKSKAPTLNHFYEKLLLLKDQLHTKTAIEIAEERHNFMEQFLDQFYKEWNTNTNKTH